MGQPRCGECFVCSLVGVFRELRRVLRTDGTLWLNLGDTCFSSHGNGRLKTKDIAGVPWRTALALQADGWFLRQDIIWSKPSCMPESVKDRCTRSHEYLFLLSQSPNYYFDCEAIKSRSEGNRRSVWTIPLDPYDGKHFAVFPRQLASLCLLAGTSQKGCCGSCGRPYLRIVESLGYTKSGSTRKRGNRKGQGGYHDQGEDINKTGGGLWMTRTVEWRPQCECGADIVPCVVLDPFIGSGTTGIVAAAHGRHSIGIDLCRDYLDHHAVPRIRGAILDCPEMAAAASPVARKCLAGEEI